MKPETIIQHQEKIGKRNTRFFARTFVSLDARLWQRGFEGRLGAWRNWPALQSFGWQRAAEKIQTETPTDVIKFAVKKSGIEAELGAGTDEEVEKLENIKELATLALKYDNLENGRGIEKLLEDASLASDQDSLMINEEKLLKQIL